jgi:hypothetical protein
MGRIIGASWMGIDGNVNMSIDLKRTKASTVTYLYCIFFLFLCGVNRLTNKLKLAHGYFLPSVTERAALELSLLQLLYSELGLVGP